MVFGATAVAMLVLGSATLAAPAAVTIQSSSFVPQAVTVNVGETVTWTNRDFSQHTATAAGVFDTGTLSMGQSRSIQMTRAGTFQYLCVIHTFMTGSVTVVGPATPPPTAPPTPIPSTPRPVTPTPVRTVTPVPATAAPTAPPVPATATPSESPPPTPASTVAATAAPSAVAQSSPTPRSDPPAAGSAAPSGTDSGPGPALAVAAALLAVGVAGLVAYLARRR